MVLTRGLAVHAAGVLLLALYWTAPRVAAGETNAQAGGNGRWVNPFIGTAGGGNTYPGAQAPFGMVAFNPSTAFDDYSHWSSRPAYDYDRTQIKSFTLTHISGIGCHAMQDLPFTPTTRELDVSPVGNRDAYVASYSHAREQAEPGYYRVFLVDPGIEVELTATTRAGMSRFAYPSGAPKHLVLAPGNSANGVVDSEIRFDEGTGELSGWARSGGFCDRDPSRFPYAVFFSAVFDRAVDSVLAWKGPGARPGVVEARGNDVALALTFARGDGAPVQMKIGLSYVSVENARLNRSEELPSWDFDAVRAATRAAWEATLSAIRLEGVSDEGRTVFYTALYHNALQPSVFEDVNGEYIGFDDRIHAVEAGHHHYANFSLWDTYRTTAQLQAILYPDRAADMVTSLIVNAEQSPGGGLVVWGLNNTDNGCMGGYSADPFIANVHAFGADAFDLERARRKMVATALSDHANKGSRGWSGVEDYRRLGYVPHERFPAHSVSMTVEYAIDDFSISRICQAAGDEACAAQFLQRSQSVFRLLNDETGHLHPRLVTGAWLDPHQMSSSLGFEEGNTVQYTWSIPHNLGGLIRQLGGSEVAEQRLDRFFEKILTTGWNIREPYYWLGNEPCFGVPYVYNWAGRPDKTQQTVWRVMAHFRNSPDGLAGNDDVGAMSGLYLFSALGLYPAIPGVGGLTVSGPAVPVARIALGGGRTLTITATGAGRDSPYVQSLTVNGTRSSRPWIDWRELTSRPHATIDFVMGPKPHPTWARSPADAPPSFSPRSAGAVP